MKMSGGPASVNLKLTLIIIASAIAAGTYFYTQDLVQKLKTREKQIVQLYAKSLEYIADSERIDNDFTFIFENIIQRIDFPLILTDSKDEVSDPRLGRGIKNIELDTTMSGEELTEFLKQKIKELGETHPPIIVSLGKNIILTKIYYGNSDLIQRLQFYPYLQIIFALIFILIAYISFSYLKKSEQSNIWIGMAKETAHQLGTPISSLMGWQEILKLNLRNPDKVMDISEEMNNDLARLTKITNRFSKIGSKPELAKTNVNEVIERVIQYFQRRLPQTGKTVSISLDGSKNVFVKINDGLFEWVIENLIKNALDAIDLKSGIITFFILENTNSVEIEITDTGKGIDLKRRKDVFRPGYSTKRRGWGLGLSLSKRIIEDYHNGKIFLKDSIMNHGSTFKIILKK